MVGKICRQAQSVFEWGLGESSYIAAEVEVPRYGGIDSDDGPCDDGVAQRRHGSGTGGNGNADHHDGRIIGGRVVKNGWAVARYEP